MILFSILFALYLWSRFAWYKSFLVWRDAAELTPEQEEKIPWLVPLLLSFPFAMEMIAFIVFWEKRWEFYIQWKIARLFKRLAKVKDPKDFLKNFVEMIELSQQLAKIQREKE